MVHGPADVHPRVDPGHDQVERVAEEDSDEEDVSDLATGLADVMQDMTGGDERRLRFLIERHAKYTNSSRAREILSSWETALPNFVKVMPVDYRRAMLDAQAAAEQDQISLAAGE